MKPASGIFAKQLLATRKYVLLQSLKVLSRDCNFENTEDAVYCDECIRDSYGSGPTGSEINFIFCYLQLENVYLKTHWPNCK